VEIGLQNKRTNMRTLKFIVAAVGTMALLTSTLRARPVDSELMQKRLQFESKLTKKVHLGYLLYLPTEYQPTSPKRWPLIFFLHGAGERGTNLSLVTMHGPPKLVKATFQPPKNESDAARQRREAAMKVLKEQFIIVSPQCPANQRWENDALLALLDKVTSKHKVDTNRIYLTGLSMGGYGSWSLGTRYPERFAAITPICGGGERIDILLASRTKAAALKTLGVWAFHGANDSTVPLNESERMIEALKKAGATDVQLTVYPEAQHDSWTEAYNNPELYEWFLKHERTSTARR
jgi:predicted peptidase